MYEHNPSNPSFKSTLFLKGMNLQKNFNEAFLQHIFSVFSVMGKPVTHSKHFRTVSVIQFPLGSSLIF